jgi:RecA/RadA recombinase
VPETPLAADLLAHLPGTVQRGHTSLEREERLATGYAELDAVLSGGLPRGWLSEVVSRSSSGATSLAHRLLAEVTSRANFAAWVDAANAFDPTSAEAAGAEFQRLLWVRPPDAAAAVAATELLAAMGGFALVLLDAARPSPGSGTKPRRAMARGERMLAAPQTWMRLARAAARSQTALVVLAGPATRVIGAATGVRLELSRTEVMWDGASGAPTLLDGLVARVDVKRCRGLGGERQVQIRLA